MQSPGTYNMATWYFQIEQVEWGHINTPLKKKWEAHCGFLYNNTFLVSYGFLQFLFPVISVMAVILVFRHSVPATS